MTCMSLSRILKPFFISCLRMGADVFGGLLGFYAGSPQADAGGFLLELVGHGVAGALAPATVERFHDDLLDHAADRQRHIELPAERGSQADVLAQQGEREGGRLVAAGKHAAWDLVVEHMHAADQTSPNGLPQDTHVHSGFYSQRQAFGDGLCDAAANELMDELADAGAADRAGVDDLVAVGRQDGPDALDDRLLAADHDLVDARR